MVQRVGVALISAASLCATGCASVVTAWKNDPLQVYAVRNDAKSVGSIYAMTGDRRTAILFKHGDRFRFCAESLPDAVAAFSAASRASASVESKAKGEFADAALANVLQTFQRTEIAEVYRQIGWNLCLAWAQDSFGDKTRYDTLMSEYIRSGLHVIEARAGQEPKAIPPVLGNVTMTWPNNLIPGAEPAAPPKTPPDKVDLTNGVALKVSSASKSGYCIVAPKEYAGDGSLLKPKVSESLPLCT